VSPVRDVGRRDAAAGGMPSIESAEVDLYLAYSDNSEQVDRY